MGIDIKRETEHGEQEAAVFDPKGLFQLILGRCRNRQWRLIHYIDPYGDSLFNQLQLPTLLEELRAIDGFTQSEEERAFLNSVLNLVEHSQNQVHTYVRFCGD